MGILGKTKNEAWGEFAESMGAEFIKASALKNPKVSLTYRFWEILLDTYTVSTGNGSVTYTRARAVFVRDAEFDFKISKSGVFTRMAKALGRAYAYTGDAEFDGVFAIRSSNEALVQKIFEKGGLKQMLFELKPVGFSVKKAKGRKETKQIENERELLYNVAGVIKDTERLTLIFGIMINLLDAFEENGIAKSEAPRISYV